MNIKIAIFIMVISAILLSSSCARKDLRAEPAEKFGNPVTDVAKVETSPDPVITEGKDNSKIVATRDIYGSLIETRTFKDHALIDNLVIKTLADGSKIGSMFDKSGNKVMLADHQIALALSSSGDDLAASLGLSQTAPEQPSVQTITKVVPSLPSEPNSAPLRLGTGETGRAEPLVEDAPPTRELPPLKAGNTSANGPVRDEKLIRMQQELRNELELRRMTRPKS